MRKFSAVLAILLVFASTGTVLADKPVGTTPDVLCLGVDLHNNDDGTWRVAVIGNANWWRIADWYGTLVGPPQQSPTWEAIPLEYNVWYKVAGSDDNCEWHTFMSCVFTTGQCLAIQHESFEATCGPDGVLLTWTTVDELDTEVYTITRDGKPLALVPSQGPGLSTGFQYAYLDADPGSYYTLSDGHDTVAAKVECISVAPSTLNDVCW